MTGKVCLVTGGTSTTDGYESMFAGNYRGHFLLTNLLLPMRRESAPSRVVAVSGCLTQPAPG